MQFSSASKLRPLEKIYVPREIEECSMLLHSFATYSKDEKDSLIVKYLWNCKSTDELAMVSCQFYRWADNFKFYLNIRGSVWCC